MLERNRSVNLTKRSLATKVGGSVSISFALLRYVVYCDVLTSKQDTDAAAPTLQPSSRCILSPPSIDEYRSLGGVDEVRTNITEISDFRLALALDKVVALAGLALVVLHLQHDVGEHRSSEQAHEHVSEHRAVAGPVSRLLRRHVDVGRNDTVHVTPADDYADHDTALERALDVVGRPSQRIRNGRVDSSRAQERSGVLDVRVLAGEQHCETDATHQRNNHVAVPAVLGAIGEPPDEDSHSGSDGVRRHGHELQMGSLVAHAVLEDGRQEERERVQRAQAAHVLQRVHPGLPVLDGLEHVLAADLLLFRARLVVGAETTLGTQTLLGSQETGGVGEVEHHLPAEAADEHGHETFENNCQALEAFGDRRENNTHRSSAIPRSHRRLPSG